MQNVILLIVLYDCIVVINSISLERRMPAYFLPPPIDFPPIIISLFIIILLLGAGD